MLNTEHIESRQQTLLRSLLPAVLLVCWGFGLYIQNVNFDYVSWDDPWYVQNNELIKSWSLNNLYHILTDNVARNYAPLTIFSFLLDQTIYGDWAGGFHLTNILLHLLNTVLVLKLVEQLTKNQYLSFFTATCFLIHPLQVETVSWISSRKGLLSATFMLLAMQYWCQVERKPKHEIQAIGLLLLALLSKAIAIILPGLFLIYDVYYQQKKINESLGKVLLPSLFCVIFLVWTANAQTTIVGGVREHIGMSKFEILLIDALLCWKYVAMLVMPQDLCVLYDPVVKDVPLLIGCSLVGWFIVAVVLYLSRTRFPQAGFAILSIGMLMFPVLNFFPITTLMNDRYLYLPIVPFYALAGGGLQYTYTCLMNYFSPHSQRDITQNRRLSEKIQSSMNAKVLGIYVVLMIAISPWNQMNYERQQVWLNSYSLWNDAMQKVPQLSVVQIQWANTLQESGHTEDAIVVLERALQTSRIDEQDMKRIKQKIELWSAR